MGKRAFYLMAFGLILTGKVFSEEVTVGVLSEGSCWFEQSEVFKLASFNDKESMAMSRDEIEFQVEALVQRKNQDKVLTNDLSLHCGGYGASLVVKTDIDNKASCLWLKLNKGKLELRSMGGLEPGKNYLCDGYKWGELIVGLKTKDQAKLLESDSFHSIIKNVSTISGTTMKVVLKEEYHGRELEVISDLKKQIDVRYIELNLFQHPVGDSVSLK